VGRKNTKKKEGRKERKNSKEKSRRDDKKNQVTYFL
jgi:hypothetical protein